MLAFLYVYMMQPQNCDSVSKVDLSQNGIRFHGLKQKVQHFKTITFPVPLALRALHITYVSLKGFSNESILPPLIQRKYFITNIIYTFLHRNR